MRLKVALLHLREQQPGVRWAVSGAGSSLQSAAHNPS